MNIPILLFLLILSFFIESTYFSAPLIFSFSILIFRKILILIHLDEKNHRLENALPNTLIFLVGMVGLLIAGFVSDSARMNHIGVTPLSLFVTFMVIHIYTKFYELASSRLFVVLFFIAVVVYSLIAHFDFIQTLLMVVGFVVARAILFVLQKKYGKNWSRIS